jgi:hypothetical protein
LFAADFSLAGNAGPKDTGVFQTDFGAFKPPEKKDAGDEIFKFDL